MSLRSFFLAAPLFVLGAALLGCNGTAACDCGPSIANPLDADENAIVQDLNNLRAGAKVGAVIPCKSLNVSAAAHADDMRNNNYLSATGQNGSDVRLRACMAGYNAACGTMIAMSELVAEGNGTGNGTFMQWSMDSSAVGHLTNPAFTQVGLGHSQGLENAYWTLDLSSVDDPSCH
jgi:uncharacterized protein YkwD